MLKTRALMGRCSSLSSLVATRPLFPWLLVKMNTGQYIYRLATSTIMCDMLIGMALSFWAFYQHLKVSCFVISCFFYLSFITTADKQYSGDAKFRKFRRQLFHSSLAKVLESLKPGMTKPEVVCCADDHFRRVIYGLGPYIADYPEQALLACIVQGWCAKFVPPPIISYHYYL